MKCPDCQENVEETKGSPVSPYINIYKCNKCGWQKLRCGDNSCDGYLEHEEMGFLIR